MLEFLFNPLLVLEPVLTVTVFAIIILILINLCYRFLINQQEAKQIKERSKELNKEMKEEQKKGNKERVSELMKEIMTLNNKLMRKTMKPMLASFVIVIIFLPWLATSYGDKTAIIHDNKGNVTIENELYIVQLESDKVNIKKDDTTVMNFTSSTTEKIGNNLYLISHEKEGGFIFSQPEQIRFARVIAKLPEDISLPLIGNEVGWLGWYLMISVPFVILIRRILKISA